MSDSSSRAFYLPHRDAISTFLAAIFANEPPSLSGLDTMPSVASDEAFIAGVQRFNWTLEGLAADTSEQNYLASRSSKDIRRVRRDLKSDALDEAGRRRTFPSPPAR
jgi:hypothetical protein